MAIKHYLVELVTEVPITINDSELIDNSVYRTVFNATQEYIDEFIEADELFSMKIVADASDSELENA
jgi:hypothetical protein